VNSELLVMKKQRKGWFPKGNWKKSGENIVEDGTPGGKIIAQQKRPNRRKGPLTFPKQMS